MHDLMSHYYSRVTYRSLPISFKWVTLDVVPFLHNEDLSLSVSLLPKCCSLLVQQSLA